MTNEKTNIEFLQDIINAETFNKEEALEFLDSIQDDQKDLQEELDGANDEINDLEEKVKELESQLDELQEGDVDSKIDCGIGEIEYNEPDNILLQDLMENLNIAIQKHTPKKVNEVLTAIS